MTVLEAMDVFCKMIKEPIMFWDTRKRGFNPGSKNPYEDSKYLLLCVSTYAEFDSFDTQDEMREFLWDYMDCIKEWYKAYKRAKEIQQSMRKSNRTPAQEKQLAKYLGIMKNCEQIVNDKFDRYCSR